MTTRHFVLRTLKVLGVLALASCFGDATGPGEEQRGALHLVPTFDATALIDFDEIRIRLTEPDSSTPFLDTTITFPAGADSLVLSLDVPGSTIGTDVTLLMQLIDQPSGDTVFTIGPTIVTPAAEGAAVASVLPPPIYVGPGANAVGVRFVSTPSEVYFQDSVTLVAEGYDAGNNAVPQAPIRWSSADTLRAFLRADSSGRVVARTVRGAVSISASLLRTSPTVNPPSVAHSVQVQPRAASIAVQSGGGQTGTVGAPLPQQITARVLAADGLPVQGVPVAFVVTSGGGSLSAPADTTDANGDAGVSWTLGTTAGGQQVTATAAGVAGSLNVGATGAPDAATRLEFLAQPTNVQAGDPITPAVTVRARDQFNNVASLTGTVDVELADNPGGSTLGGTTTRTASGNVATFNDLTLNNAGSSYTLRAAKAGFEPDTSTTFDVIATAPVALEFTVEPTTSAAGATLSPAIVVSALDISGNTAASFNGSITIAIGNNPGGATLSGTTTVAAVSGVATFSDLSLTTRGAGYTLTASASGLTGATSQSFDQTALTLTWTNPAGGSWSNPANWSLGRVPETADSVVVSLAGTYTVTLDTTFSASYLILGGASGAQTLSLNSRTLSVSGSMEVRPGGVFAVSNATVAGPGSLLNDGGTVSLIYSTLTASATVDNRGLLTTNGTSNINAVMTTSATSILRILGDGTTGFSTTNIASSFTNNGAIELTSAGSTYPAQITMPVGTTLTNATGGTITAIAAAGGGRTLAVQLDNQGTVTIQQPLTINGTSAIHDNSGSIDALADFVLSQGGTTPSFTNTGTVTIGPGATWSVSSGTLNQNAGSIGGTGTLSLASTTANFATSFSNATTGLLVNSATINGPGTITNAAGRTLMLRYGTIGASATLDNQGVLESNGTSNINGPFTMAAGATLRLVGDGSTGFSTLNIANSFTNLGAIELSSIGSTYPAQITMPAGALLTNAPGGTITTLVATGGSRFLAAALDNQGLLTIQQPLTINGTSSNHNNSGTIDAAADFVVSQGGTTPSFTNTGTVTIGAGRTWTISSGTLNQNAGSIGGPGTLSLASVTANFATSFSNATTSLVVSSSTLNGPGTITNEAGHTLVLHYGTIGASATLDNQGLLQTNGTGNINGPFLMAAGSMLRVLPDGSTGFSTLNIANSFTNSGAIELTSLGSTYPSQITLPTGMTLTNAPGGTITSLPGSGGGRTLSVQLDNQGTVTIQHPLALIGGNAAHSNSGTIDGTAASWSLTQSGAPATFSNTGTITIGSGTTWTVTSGTLNQNAGSIGGPGTLSLASVTANFATNISNATTGLLLSSTTINGPGTVTNEAGRTLVMHYSTIGASSALINNGLLISNGTSGVQGPLTASSGSTLRLQPDGSTGFTTLTITNGFVNDGAIELTSIASTYPSHLAVTNGTLVNAPGGTIMVAAGTGGGRTLAAEIDNQGLLTIQQPLDLNYAGGQHSNSGTIDASTSWILSQSGGGASFTNTGTITIGAGTTWSVSTGIFNQNAGSVGGSGTLSLASVTANFATNFTNATTGLLVSSSTLNGPGTITNAPGRTLTLHYGIIGATSALDNQGLLVSNGTSAINGPLTTTAGSILRLQPDGSTGFTNLTVDSGFTNNGAIELTSVASTYSANLTIAGTLLNAPGGTITSAIGTGGTRTLTAELTNQGTLTIDQALAINGTSADHANSGSIALAGGDLGITQGGTTPTFTNSGTINVAAGRTLAINGGLFTQLAAGTLSGSGAMNVSSATFDMQDPFTLSALTLTSSTVNLASGLSTGATLLTLNSSSINGPGTVTNAAGQTLILNYGTIGVTSGLDNQGTLVSNGTSAINGPLTTTAGSILRLQPDGSTGFSNLTVDSTFTNNGAIELTSSVSTYSATLTVQGTLINAPGGTFTSLVGTGGSRAFTGELTNQGQVTIDQALLMNGASADHFNSGTVDLTTGNLNLAQGGTSPSFTNAGTVTVAAGLTFQVSNGTFVQQSGATLSGAGALAVSSATADFQTPYALAALALQSATANLAFDLSTATTDLQVSSSTINGPGLVLNPAGGVLVLFYGTIGATSGVTNGGLLQSNGTSAINGPLIAAPSSWIRLLPDGSTGFSNLTIANGFTNDGTIELTSTVSTYSATLVVGAGTLLNGAGGTILSEPGTGGGRTINAPLDNQGLVTVNQTLTLNAGSADHSNSGTIDLVAGNLLLNQGGTTPSFVNSGTITVGALQTFAISSGAFTQQAGGTLSGAGALNLASVAADIQTPFALGTLDMTSSTVSLAGDLSTATTSLGIASSTINGPGRVINDAGVTLNLFYGTIGATSGLDNFGTLVSNGTTNINGPLNTALGSILRLQPDGSTGFSTLTVDSSFTNNGAIELTSVTSGYSATLVVAGTLTNAAGGTFTSAIGTFGPRTLTAQLNNEGLFTINQPLTLNGVNADHINTATIDVAGGDLTLTQTGATPRFDNFGTITVGAGRSWSIGGGIIAQQTGATLTGAGTLNLTGGSFDVQAPLGIGALNLTGSSALLANNLSTATTTLSLSGSSINGPGIIINDAGETLTMLNGTISASSGLNNSGTVVTNGTGTISGPLTTAVGSILRLQPDGSTGFSTLTVANGFTNNGTIELTSIVSAYSAQLNVTTGTLLNAASGTIASLAGTGGNRNLSAQIDNQGTIAAQRGINNAGLLGIAGGLNTSGDLAIEIGGLAAGTGHSQILVTGVPGSANVLGALTVTLAGGFTPSIGDLFTILTRGSGSGAFGVLNLPTLVTGTWAPPVYNAGSIVLTVVP